MAVDDAELLALAGGDSSDEETQQPTSIAKATSPLPSIEISQADSNNFAASSGRSRVRGGSTKVVKKPRKDDSEESGEALSDSATSQQSAPMSESESDVPGDDPGDDDIPFPVDNKFHSEKEKREIMTLPEIEREAILADRAAVHERKMQDLRLRRLLQARTNEEAKSSKRKAGTDLEDSPRKSSRQKTTLGGRKVGEASGAIEAYKKQREEKGLRDAERRRAGLDRKQLRARSSSDVRYSSADADGDSEVEWDDGKAKANDARLRNAQPADYHDFRRITWTRSMLAEHCCWPGFENTLKDCYVRIAGKPHPTTRAMQYEVALVKSVFEKENYDYALDRPNGKKIITKQHFTCMVDGKEEAFWFGTVSNTVASEVEVANYKNALADAGKAIPTKPLLMSKLQEIHDLMDRTWTDAELHEKLKRTGVLAKRVEPLQRNEIASRRRAAEERGDEAGIAKADAELMALSGPTKLKYNTFLIDPRAPPPTVHEPTQQDRLAEINKSNRKRNTEDVRKAQHAEKRAARLEREAVLRGEAVQNPFARVKVLSKTHHDVNSNLTPKQAREQSQNRSRAGTPSTPLLTAKKEVSRLPTPERKPLLTKGGLPVMSSRNMDDEVLGAMDLGIDVEI